MNQAELAKVFGEYAGAIGKGNRQTVGLQVAAAEQQTDPRTDFVG
jgi:hypothetical protein